MQTLRLALSLKLARTSRALRVWCFVGLAGAALGADVELRLTPKAAGRPIQSAAWTDRTDAGEEFSLTRASLLLSGLALQRADGSWLELTNDAVWFDLGIPRLSQRLTAVPHGEYRAIRFHVGVDPSRNHGDPAQFPPDHPLNPNLNNLHWSWQGGYIFMALEGLWRRPDGELEGWSFHFARDENRTAVTLSAKIPLTADATIDLVFDPDKFFNGSHAISFGRDGTSTHSRPGDPILAALATNLPGAFQLASVQVSPAASIAPAVAGATRPLYLPANFTPYRFATSATFPLPDLPRDNPLTEERVALGELLFHETALSRDSSLSCASCHDARHAFADPRRFSVGVRGQQGSRNAMPLFNLAWKTAFFWDGRAPSLRAQALMPIQDHAEMDETLTNVVARLARSGKARRAPVEPKTDYATLFAAAFGSPEITAEKIGLALESFLLTLTSHDSKFDRSLNCAAELSAEEQRGLQLFMTEYDPRRGQFGADCFHCHGGPLFQSQTWANNGLDAVPPDRGREQTTGRESDRGKFATPSLRNVALTAPYMHDGRFQTIEEVIDHYSTGVKRSATLDPNLAKHPDGGVPLSAEDKRALAAFLRTLTDEKFNRLTLAAETPRP